MVLLHVWGKKEKELIMKTSDSHMQSFEMNHHVFRTKLVQMAAMPYLQSSLDLWLQDRGAETGILPDNTMRGV